jgi:hypothetical protein
VGSKNKEGNTAASLCPDNQEFQNLIRTVKPTSQAQKHSEISIPKFNDESLSKLYSKISEERVTLLK